MRSIFSVVPVGVVLFGAGCADGAINIFTIEDDKALGQQLVDEINADPATYPVLDEAQYPEAYDHVRAIRDAVLASGEVDHADDFDWDVHIIHDDSTLNAFCAPGGYMYFYSGIIQYLDNEDEFAGVMGHEMAHAANRHATEQLTKQYGLSALIELALGKNPGLIPEVAAGLVTLQFSRTDEAEADEYSVRYLCETAYASDGASGFFEQLEASGDGTSIPAFLSDHPDPANRITDIQSLATDLGCSTVLNPDADYQALKDALPPYNPK